MHIVWKFYIVKLDIPLSFLQWIHDVYPIPIAPLVWYHVGDLSYDLWTTLLHFPFLVFSLYPTHSFTVRPIANRRTARSGSYHMFCHTRTLCSFYLLFVFKTFVSTPKKKEVFPQNSDFKFVSSHHFASLRLCTFAPSHTSETDRKSTRLNSSHI